MPKILLSASFPEELLIRQTPGNRGYWQEFQFATKPEDGPIDGWVVYDNLREPLEQMCPRANTLFITGEPESLRKYRPRFTSQFANVWTSHSSIQHRSVQRRHEAQHWHYALCPGSVHRRQLGFDEIKDLRRPAKSKLMSVICSSKASTEDHRRRLHFVQQLKETLGEQVDVFGRGIRTIDDKSEAIYDYRYHIVLENDHSDCFMTEKLGDAFLGWSYPIYFGGPEAYHRYPEGSFTAIDIYKPSEAISIIQNVIAADMYSSHADVVARARDEVVFKNNICNLLAEYWRENLIADERPEKIELVPKNHRATLTFRQIRRAIKGTWQKKAA